MKIYIVTASEANLIGLSKSKLIHEGYGAFGERDNSYEQVVHMGNSLVRLSDNDLVLYTGESPNREVLQVISEWNTSDRLLEIMNPDALENRKKERYKRYLDLKKEIQADGLYDV